MTEQAKNTVFNFAVRLAAMIGLNCCAAPTWARSAEPSSGDFASSSIKVDLTPDLWLLRFKTADQIGPISANADLPFHTVFKNLDSVALGEIVVRKGPVFALADLSYARLTLHPQAFAALHGTIGVTGLWTTFGAGYTIGGLDVGRIGSRPIRLAISPFAGVAYTNLKVVVRANDQAGKQAEMARVKEGWWNPVAGVRLDLTSGPYVLRLSGYTSHFGRGRSGDQLLSAVGYTVNAPRVGNPTLLLGYRYFHEKRVINAVEVFRTTLEGPVLGATFHL